VSTNISIIEVQNKNDKPLGKSRLKEACVFVNGAYIEARGFGSENFIGRHKPSPTKERSVAFGRPSRHELLVEAEDYKPLKSS
jgi:hypothetical protein